MKKIIITILSFLALVNITYAGMVTVPTSPNRDYCLRSTSSGIYNYNSEFCGGYSGVYSAPSITNNGDGTITLGTGIYHFYTDISYTSLGSYTISTTTLSLNDNVTNYVVGNYNGGSPVVEVRTSVVGLNNSTVIPILTVFREGNDLDIISWDEQGKALSEKILGRLMNTERFAVVPGGLILGEIPTRYVTISAGQVWYGAAMNNLGAVDTSSDELTIYKHVAGVWTASSSTQYNNTQYDNGTNLVNLGGANYAVNWVFRDAANNMNEAYIILGQGNYNLAQAQNSTLPTNLPTELSTQAIFVGRIIVLKNASTATQIDSAFTSGISTGTITPPGDGTGSIQFNNNGAFDGTSTQLYWDISNAKLGIGTSTPNAKLTIDASSPSVGAGIAGATIYGGNGVGSGNPGGDIILVAGEGAPISSGTAGSGGNFVIRTGNGGIMSNGGAGGNGGSYSLIAGNGSSNTIGGPGGIGGSLSFTAGSGGSSRSGPQGGAAGNITLTAGNGNIDPTFASSNGGSITLNPGVPGSGALSGNILLASLNGLVGIGTSSPSAKLAIHDSSGLSTSTLLFSIASSTSSGLSTTTVMSVSGNGDTRIAGNITVSGISNSLGTTTINGQLTSGPLYVNTSSYLPAGLGSQISAMISNPTDIARLVFRGQAGAFLGWQNLAGTTDQKKIQIYIDSNGSLNISMLNDAESAEKYALQFTRSGYSPSTAQFLNGVNVGINTGVATGGTVSAKLHVISTTEQLRLGYNTTNYYSTTINSTGAVAFNAIGTTPNFSFADNVGIGSTTPGTALVVVGTTTTSGINIPAGVSYAGQAVCYMADGSLGHQTSAQLATLTCVAN